MAIKCDCHSRGHTRATSGAGNGTEMPAWSSAWLNCLNFYPACWMGFAVCTEFCAAGSTHASLSWPLSSATTPATQRRQAPGSQEPDGARGSVLVESRDISPVH